MNGSERILIQGQPWQDSEAPPQKTSCGWGAAIKKNDGGGEFNYDIL
jgi:hypothetical protein